MFGEFSLLTVTIVSSAVLLGGLLAVILGRVAIVVRGRFDLSERGEAAVKGAFLAALACSLCGSGFLVTEWGGRDVLMAGSALAVFSLASLGLSRNFAGVLFSGAALGLATGLLQTATIVAMPAAFPLQAPPVGIPAATNLGFIFVALGGLVIPVLVVLLVRKFTFRNGLLVAALFAVVPGVLAAFAGGWEPTSAHQVDLTALATDFRFWLALAAVGSFYGLETSALRWAPLYLEEIHLRPRSRVVLWVMFWAIFLGTRLACVGIHTVAGYFWVVAILALVTAVLFGNMINMFHSHAGATSFLIAGGSLGPIFPTLAGLMMVLFPSQPAVTLGLLCAGGTLSRMMVGPLTDRLLARGKVRQTMGLSMVLGIVVFFPPLIWMVLPY